jgi:hypothetical protein
MNDGNMPSGPVPPTDQPTDQNNTAPENPEDASDNS